MYRESEIARPYLDSDSPLSPYNEYYPYVLLYLPSLNRFVDSDWKIIHDLSELFDTWELDSWKRARKDGDLYTRDEISMRLYYLTQPEEEDVLDYMRWSELHYGVMMDTAYPNRRYLRDTPR